MEANKSIPNSHNVNFSLQMIEVALKKLNKATEAFLECPNDVDRVNYRMTQLNALIDAHDKAVCL